MKKTENGENTAQEAVKPTLDDQIAWCDRQIKFYDPDREGKHLAIVTAIKETLIANKQWEAVYAKLPKDKNGMLMSGIDMSLETSEDEAIEPQTELDYNPDLVDKTKSIVPANHMLRDVRMIGRKGAPHV
jgi:hypothetical protein